MTDLGTGTGAGTIKHRPRACEYCNKSKARCVWPGEPGSESCHRCTRLGHECLLPEQRERRKRGPSTRVGQLEQKVDDIMTLLNSHHTQQTSHTRSSGSRQQDPSPPSGARDPTAGLTEQCEVVSDLRGALPPLRFMDSNLAVHSLPPTGEIDIAVGFRIYVEQGDKILDRYRKEYSDQFPFMPIPLHLGAVDLLSQRPFLFRTLVLLIAPQNPALQCDLRRWFRSYVAEHVIVNQEKRLELLQALLLFIAWDDFHSDTGSFNSSLLQIAVGLVVDLGLGKPFKSYTGQAPNTMMEDDPPSQDDMRAFLGCCYLHTLSAVLFRREPAVEFPSLYVGMCCGSIETGAEYESDRYLVTMVKMRRIMWRIDGSLAKVGDNKSRSMPIDTYEAMSTLRADLEKLREELPSGIQRHWSLELVYHGTLVRLYEPAIHMRPPSGPADIRERGRRTDVLWCCLDAAKAFFDLYLTIPAEVLTGLPMATISWMSFVTCTMTAFLFLDDRDWNPQIVCQGAGLVSITQAMGDLYDQADRVVAGQEWGRKRRFVDANQSLMVLHRDKMRSLTSLCHSKLMPGNG